MASIINNTPGFLLTYAGIPFFTDNPKVFRIGMKRTESTASPETQRPERKQQPLEDLIDEIDRLIPFRYAQDFGLPPPPQRNLNNLGRRSQFGPWPSPDQRIGDWYYPHDATRWSCFRGLMTSTQVKLVLSQTLGATSAPFIMSATPDGPIGALDYSVSTNLYMLPPRCLGEHGGAYDGLYLITLVDERYWHQYVSSTLRIHQDTTWDNLLFQLATELGIILTWDIIPPAYTSPEPDSQLWTNKENASLLLDSIAYSIGRTVVRNLDGTYRLMDSVESANRVNQNIVALGDVYRARYAGGDIFQPGGTALPIGPYLQLSRNSVVPGRVNVTFPKYVLADDFGRGNEVPHFLNPRYQNQRPSCWYEDSYGAVHSIEWSIIPGGNVFFNSLNQSGAGPIGAGSWLSGLPLTESGTIINEVQISGVFYSVGPAHTIHTTAKALFSGEAHAAQTNTIPLNNEGLLLMTERHALDFYADQLAAAYDEVFPGTASVLPEGIHDIVWSYSPKHRIASTRIVRGQWNDMSIEKQNATPVSDIGGIGADTCNVKGVGGPSVAQTIRDRQGLENSNLQTFSTTLAQTLLIGQTTAVFADVDFFPTQNRWRGRIENEWILFEGTSGGLGPTGAKSVEIVYRAIDGTLQTNHNDGVVVRQTLPNATYGVNLTTYEKSQFTYPHEWTSGGLQGARIIPQIQSVYCHSASGAIMLQRAHLSGSVMIYNPTLAGDPFEKKEDCWIVPRVSGLIISGHTYGGQFVGYSTELDISGTRHFIRPVYTVESFRLAGDAIEISGCQAINVVTSILCCSGDTELRIEQTCIKVPTVANASGCECDPVPDCSG